MTDITTMVTDEVTQALGRSETLPTDWYTDATIFEREQTRIFRCSWQYVGHVRRVSQPGDRFSSHVGDVPVAIVRDYNDELNGFVNICRHRQHAVVRHDDNGRLLQCPYHGWTYNLDGTLRKAPRADASPDFDASHIALQPVRVDTWGPLIFANLWFDAPPLADILGTLPSQARDRGLDLASCTYRETRLHGFACNWKVYVENACECYHCQLAHPALARAIDVRPDSYALELHEWYSAQLSRRRTGSGEQKPIEELAHEGEGYQFYYVWPNLFLGTATGSQSYAIHRVDALDVDHARLGIEYYFHPDVDQEAAVDAMAFNGATLGEDRALVESVQRSLRAGAVQHGQLMLPSESLLLHFQRLVAQALG